MTIRKFCDINPKLSGCLLFGAAVVLAFTASAILASTVSAYNNFGRFPCKWEHEDNTILDMPYRNDPQYPAGGKFATAYALARSDWLLSDTPIDFDSDNEQTNHVMGVRNLGAMAPLGRMDDECTGTFIKRRVGSTVILNWYKLINVNDNDAIQMVATHEVGHFIGARHSNVKPAIMNSPLNYPTIYHVEDDDECAVNDLYTHEDYPVDCD